MNLDASPLRSPQIGTNPHIHYPTICSQYSTLTVENTNILRIMSISMTNSSMPPKHKRLTEIECAQIHALRNLKYTYQQIANELNISKGRVQFSLTKRNFSSGKQRGRKPYLSDEQVDEIEAFVCSSRETRRMSYLELARTRFAEWGATENQIKNSLQRRGYARRIARRKPSLTEDL